MEIKILDMIEGAREAKGLTVIIDVFRAFSVAAYAFHNKAEKIIPVGDLDFALELKEKNPSFILLGERNEQKVPGFDFGNSPSQILHEDFTGKTLVHTTSSGTQGIVNAVNANEILTGSFVNAGAIVSYIRSKAPRFVSLVPMGYACLYPVEEDSLCALYIKNELEGKPNDFPGMVETIRQTSGKRFFIQENQSFAPSIDFSLCTELNRFNFVIKASENNGQFVLNRYDNW